ncbi:MAG: hypothetical protein CLLPBCKN_008567 [Chroococcidiopsis cubana SAG 39.79]|uniref:Uncharacterized protein n=1 Tax=Chroococcidiopsis cubana SAG 39.79 TaxID=388085 RepID=A0AB37U8P0_9CYAN|nr:hypothetical protein [Chroococcidiopsis cubana]MDZ4879129.1 hypothetical protein [Chroococcidiopsis cubana SAG 39.79]PSB65153.1 hypothetical protein C7B79_06625 [Chroococcidiopsis cubana CCALA 043]RUT00493.1 hypothetical protein DSM107010_67770 [Chroococcidiopsis cubana SAG 39.79]
MLETPSEREKHLQELEELELKCGGVFACITPERHKILWQQKVSKLEQRLEAATTAQQREYLLSQLIELNQREQRKATRIAEVHSLLAPGS